MCVLTGTQHSSPGSPLAGMDTALGHEFFVCGSVEGMQREKSMELRRGQLFLVCSLFLIITSVFLYLLMRMKRRFEIKL